MASDPQLRRWYLKFNDMYFNSSLPHDLELWWEACHGSLGETFEMSLPDKDAKDIAVRIDPSIRFSPLLSQLTLLHEMVHVKHYPRKCWARHGKEFNSEMLRLAQIGAFKGRW